jgi:hypothetical protein
MKNPDEAINKVLTALANPKPPAGMERRILEVASAEVTAGPKPARWALGYGIPVAISLAALLWIAKTYPYDPIKTPPQIAVIEPHPVVVPQAATTLAAQRPARLTASVSRNQHHTTSAFVLAKSYPAPPMPLTEQEKLLLRVVRKGDPEELAMLNPETRARREAQDTDQFHQFFEHPRSGVNE